MNQHIALMPRVIGSLFYYSPDSPQVNALIPQIESLSDLFEWRDRAKIGQICQNIELPKEDQLIWQFSVLFEGQGEMVAPPWGSVYLDKDNLLMGDSTVAYRHFLATNGIAFVADVCQPEDQFGLMLLAAAQLLEQEKTEAVKALLEQHLMPWSYRYLECLANNTISPFYAALANIATLFLQDLQTQYALKPAELRLRF